MKSSYNLEMQLELGLEGSCSSSMQFLFYGRDCGKEGHLPPKIKICCWKTLDNIVPTLTILQYKGVSSSIWCPFCCKSPVTI